MIIKFCFQEEIHRTSEPPQDFSAFAPFLAKMFTTKTLPQRYTLSCSTPDGQIISLNSQEDYEVLKNRNYKKPVKIFIIAEPETSTLELTQENSSPEEVNIEFETSQNQVFSGTLDLEEKIKDLEIQECVSIAQEGIYTSYYKMPEETIDSKEDPSHNDKINSILFSKEGSLENDRKLANSFYYEPPRDLEQECLQKTREANRALNETEIKNIVRETIEQQMPVMYAQFKQALLNEGFIQRPSSYPTGQQQQQQPIYPSYNYSYQPPQYYHQQPQPQYYQARHIPQRYYQQHIPHPQYYQQKQEQENPDLFGKVMNVISYLPGKAVNMVDNFAKIIEGDPYIDIPEGKYPRSVVDRVIHLKQLFPEAPKKDLLEFVQRFPKETSLDQLIEYWSCSRRQQK